MSKDQTDDTPASAQMTESPINTNTKNGGMRIEGRVTRPPKSTPTKRRYAVMKSYDEERQETTENDDVMTRNNEERRKTTKNDKY